MYLLRLFFVQDLPCLREKITKKLDDAIGKFYIDLITCLFSVVSETKAIFFRTRSFHTTGNISNRYVTVTKMKSSMLE